MPEITRLLGIPPDISRGVGFRPRPPAPEPLPRYSTEWVLRIPRPAPFRNRRCMPPRRPWWRDALRQLAALECLVNCSDGIQLDTGDDGRRFFVNGQHETRAMLDQGVRRTIIVQWQLPAQP